MARICNLRIHNDKHSTQELILNRELFKELSDGDYIYVYEVGNPNKKLVLKIVPVTALSMVARLDISILKSVADVLPNVKAFSSVCVEKADRKDAEVDFVELTFKKLYLQRGNLWRFQAAMPVGQTIHVNGSCNIDGITAQVQELGKNGSEMSTCSGIVSENTHFIFRSRSTRIIWLVQISKEMYECDQNNDLYFEKFLYKFVEPLIDQWKSMGVSHLLSVIFFTRTLYPEQQLNQKMHIKNISDWKNIYQYNSTREGIRYKDFFKTVIDSITEYDKKSIKRILKEEFWDFPRKVGWDTATPTDPTIRGIPSDAPSGNFLEAINSTLNFLDKHYIDRDLFRTGNSIVMISAGTGIFRVRPGLQQITKQRMMDNGIGMDFISLSQPPLHTVPLFLVECSNENGIKDFYEVPHWMNITFVDCDIDPSASIDRSGLSSSLSNKEIAKWRDPCDVSNKANPRWTGLEGLTIADEEMGGKLTVKDGFLHYLPPENVNKYIGKKFDASDIWRGENEFQPLPFSNLIAGFITAGSSSEGHLNSMSPFLSRHIHRRKDTESSSSYQIEPIRPWGWLNFNKLAKTLPAYDEDLIRKQMQWGSTYLLPGLPTDKTANAESFQDETKNETKFGSSFEDMIQSSGSTKGLYFEDLSTAHVLSLKSRAHISEVDSSMRQLGEKEMSIESLSLFDETAINFAMGRLTASMNSPTALSNIDDRMRRRSFQDRRAGGRDSFYHVLDDNSHHTFPNKVYSKLLKSGGGEDTSSPRRGLESKTHFSSSADIVYQPSTPHAQRTIISRSDRGIRHHTGSASVDALASEENEQREFIRLYRKKYAINPFRKEEGKAFLETRTHNRRRWSHVFPAYSIGRQDNAYTYFGLNKKSLTQPAILPMTTDFILPAKELEWNYDIQSTYNLMIYAGECAFNSQENLLKEMVSQRLSMEYQLVEGVDPEEYARLNKSIGRGTKTITYILSMGHRIHILTYDASGQGEIIVTRYLSKRGTNATKNTCDVYKFEVWVPQTQKFQTITQKFYQYPQPEYAWNRADEILLGNEELDTNTPKLDPTSPKENPSNGGEGNQTPQIKSRKLCFVIMPPETFDDMLEYISKIELLLQYFMKSSVDAKKIDIIWEGGSYIKVPAVPIVYKLFLKGPKHENPKWIYLRLEKQFQIRFAYHIQIHWLVCDSWLLEDWIAVLFRRCSAWGLRIVQTPEFIRTANLQIHPFRALPRIIVPFPKRSHYSSPILLIEQHYFIEQPQSWVQDGERLTDWNALGYTETKLSEVDDVESEEAAASVHKPVSFLSMLHPKIKDKSAGAVKLQPIRDRQYIHRSGHASVRLAPFGFVWLPSFRPRSNETIQSISLSTTDDRKDSLTLALKELEMCCEHWGICHSVLIDLVENVVNPPPRRSPHNSFKSEVTEPV